MKNRPVLYVIFTGFILYLLYLQEGLNLREEGSILLLASALGLTVNYIRSYLPKFHRLAVVLGSFLLVLYALLVLSNTSPLAPLLFLFPLTLSILGHGIYGGVILYLLTGGALFYHHQIFGLSEEVYLGTMIILGCALVSLLYFSRIHHQVVKNNEEWLQKLHAKINEMTLLRDITTSMQSVKDLKKLDKIVLTAITAGYGLGFNRGLLFLVEENTLVGEYAIGPSSRKEAYRIWGDVVIKQSNLHEVLDSPEEKDETLLEVVSKVSLPFSENELNPLIRCVREKTPLLIQQGNPEDFGPLLEKLSFESYAVVPMISKDQVVGVYLVDNCFNQKPIQDEDLDALITFSGQAALAFENIRLYDKIRTLAITDELTSVYNHRHYKDTIARYMESGISFILMVIDVDDFKSFNEIYGHATGDQVLQEVGRSLKNAVKYKGEAFRYGGDEFTIILPERTREEAFDVARTIQDSILSMALDKVAHPLTLSIGLAAYPEDTTCEKELFILADRKLKSAKESGKNTIHWGGGLMLTTAMSFLLFLVLIYKVPFFKRDGAIERNMLPEKAEFSIASMPFRVERIVYHVPIPNPTYGKDPHLEEHMTVEYVKKQSFDASPFALQVYYEQGRERKLLAEVLSHRFDVPYLDTLYGENLLSYKEYEYLRLYKYNHPSTMELLREEVKRKLTKGNSKI